MVTRRTLIRWGIYRTLLDAKKSGGSRSPWDSSQIAAGLLKYTWAKEALGESDPIFVVAGNLRFMRQDGLIAIDSSGKYSVVKPGLILERLILDAMSAAAPHTNVAWGWFENVQDRLDDLGMWYERDPALVKHFSFDSFSRALDHLVELKSVWAHPDDPEQNLEDPDRTLWGLAPCGDEGQETSSADQGKTGMDLYLEQQDALYQGTVEKLGAGIVGGSVAAVIHDLDRVSAVGLEWFVRANLESLGADPEILLTPGTLLNAVLELILEGAIGVEEQDNEAILVVDQDMLPLNEGDFPDIFDDDEVGDRESVSILLRLMKLVEADKMTVQVILNFDPVGGQEDANPPGVRVVPLREVLAALGEDDEVSPGAARQEMTAEDRQLSLAEEIPPFDLIIEGIEEGYFTQQMAIDSVRQQMLALDAIGLGDSSQYRRLDEMLNEIEGGR